MAVSYESHIVLQFSIKWLLIKYGWWKNRLHREFIWHTQCIDHTYCLSPWDLLIHVQNVTSIYFLNHSFVTYSPLVYWCEHRAIQVMFSPNWMLDSQTELVLTIKISIHWLHIIVCVTPNCFWTLRNK